MHIGIQSIYSCGTRNGLPFRSTWGGRGVISRHLVFVLLIVVCPFVLFISLGYCIVCPSSIYGFWLPFWYLQSSLPLLCCVVLRIPKHNRDQEFNDKVCNLLCFPPNYSYTNIQLTFNCVYILFSYISLVAFTFRFRTFR